ncbi:MAG: hypothetical protein HZA46_11380 [Planctomycetales bacterium]|nr:hypothetical protein [Planctomycetales bacterium]
MKTALVKRIVSWLESAGHYVSQQSRLVIDDVDFPCDAALLGPKDQQGPVREHLVIVQAPEREGMRAVYDQVQALTMILARTGSQRPLTLVLVTSDPVDPALSEFDHLCRMIVVPADGGGDVSVPLRPLLPLDLPQSDQVTTSPETRLKRQLGKRAADPLIAALLHAAQTSDNAVTQCMRDWLAQAIEQDSVTPTS